MQWIDALGYEEVMTFLPSTPANLFFKDTECRYLFISDVRTFFPYGEGQEEDVLGKTDLEIWSSEEQARFYYEQDQKVLATGKGTSFITEVPRKDGIAYYQIKKNPVVLEGKIIGIVGLIGDITERVRLEKQAENWAVHDDLTARRRLQQVDAAHQRALARAGHTDNAVDVSILNGQGHILQCVHASVGTGVVCLAYVFQFYHDGVPRFCLIRAVSFLHLPRPGGSSGKETGRFALSCFRGVPRPVQGGEHARGRGG